MCIYVNGHRLVFCVICFVFEWCDEDSMMLLLFVIAGKDKEISMSKKWFNFVVYLTVFI